MLFFRLDSFGGTHELLPCGLLRGVLVKLFRKSNSKYCCYDFTVRGERYRGSTKETKETRAQKAAAQPIQFPMTTISYPARSESLRKDVRASADMWCTVRILLP